MNPTSRAPLEPLSPQPHHPPQPRSSRWNIKLLFAAFFLALTLPAHPQSPVILKLSIHDTIQPITSAYLQRGLDEAAARHAAAVLISLGTPGGLLDSTRHMVAAIEASPIPVIIFIEPSSSRAGSAGFFLLEASDIAAMAPGTEAGAAHPILEGQTMDPVLKLKIENDAAAFLRSYTTVRNRNSAAAEDAVRNSKSYSESEALSLHLIDLVAPNDQALLTALNGRTIKRFNVNGISTTLNFTNAHIEPLPPSLRERLLTRLTSPDLDVLLLLAGALLIYLEFNVPGTIVPGALGTLMVLLSLFGLNLLPIEHTAILLLLAAFTLMALEAKFASHGILGLLGTLCLIVGLATLVDGPTPDTRVHLTTAAAAGLAFGLITLFLTTIALRARRTKRLLGPEALIGHPAITRTTIYPHNCRLAPNASSPNAAAGHIPTALDQAPAPIPSPIGQVEVRGELWQAHSPVNTAPIPAGTAVTVRAIHNLTLTVSP